MQEANIHYPCIAKPDFGRTGRDVKKIHNQEDLEDYCKYMHENIVIQEFIDYPLEYGVFWYRMPEEAK